MRAPNSQYLWAGVIVDELARSGVRHAVICPGSRSAPLAVACGSHGGIRCWPVPDERSAAFLALGIGKASGSPAMVVCTSGTAGAHFLPAVMEAHLSDVPLVVVTADRPPELHGFGASQTVDQQHLYGRYTRFFADVGAPVMDAGALRHLRATVSRAAHLSRGVAHLNVPLREPLAPTEESLPAGLLDAATQFTPPHTLTTRHHVMDAGRVADIVTGRGRILLLAAPRDAQDGLPDALRTLAARWNVPLLAEAASGVRHGDSAAPVIAHYEAVLRCPAAKTLAPEVILKFGGRVTTRVLQGLVDSGATVVNFSENGEVVDPGHAASLVLEGDPAAWCRSLVDLPVRVSPEYLARWRECDLRVSAALDEQTGREETLTEPAVARIVSSVTPEGSTLFVSSSMPIRDLDAFSSSRNSSLRVLANRGAAGIDGIVSSAFGVAATGARTVLLTGDTTLLHDLGGLVWGARLGLSLVVVVINNGGGRIFSFLPIGRFPEHFESLFAMPPGVSMVDVARVASARHHQPTTPAELTACMREALEGGVHVVEIVVDGAQTVAQHEHWWAAARAAVEGA
ncbi:MAG: 2-succinyl-5-enolpyruvyl-6-hydroxy-3-cyclohexene-1-carboxylic-acid synthase [Myxococcota bacterium]